MITIEVLDAPAVEVLVVVAVEVALENAIAVPVAIPLSVAVALTEVVAVAVVLLDVAEGYLQRGRQPTAKYTIRRKSITETN